MATGVLARWRGSRPGLELVPDPGGAAFYGPKISVQARDAIGRTWQMSTIQLGLHVARSVSNWSTRAATASGTRRLEPVPLFHVGLELRRTLTIIEADRHRHRVAEHAEAVADDPILHPRP